MKSVYHRCLVAMPLQQISERLSYPETLHLKRALGGFVSDLGTLFQLAFLPPIFTPSLNEAMVDFSNFVGGLGE